MSATCPASFQAKISENCIKHQAFANFGLTKTSRSYLPRFNMITKHKIHLLFSVWNSHICRENVCLFIYLLMVAKTVYTAKMKGSQYSIQAKSD